MNNEREAELRRKLTEKKDSTREVLKRIQFWFVVICGVLVLSFMLPIITQQPKEKSIDSHHLASILKWLVFSVAVLTSITVLYLKKKRNKTQNEDE